MYTDPAFILPHRKTPENLNVIIIIIIILIIILIIMISICGLQFPRKPYR